MFAKSFQLHWIVGRSDILSKHKTYFLILDLAFAIPFLSYLQKLQLVVANFEIVAAMYLFFHELKKYVSDF